MSQFKKILLFGDSITEFAYTTAPFSLGAGLSNVYTRKLDILHRGYAGYNSRWAIKVLKDILNDPTSKDIVIATIFFGANDSCLGGEQKVPLEEYLQNMKQLASMLQECGIKPIFVGLGLFNRELWEVIKVEDVEMGRIRTSDNLQLYSNSLKKLAQENNIPFLDLHEVFTKRGGDNWKELLTDGLHFSSSGYQIWYDELLAAINENYPEFHPDNMTMQYPLWRDVKEDMSNL